jgi:FlaG/FlaF family flagellin (archaellin)
MTKIYASLTVCITVALAGCGQVEVFGRTIGEPKSTSQAEAELVSNPANVAEFQKVKAVMVVLTEQATAKTAADAKFNADALLSAVKSELQSREALEDSNAQLTAVAEIAIDDYALHPTSNVVLFGQIISTGVLSGTLRVRDAQGNELSNRRIEAKARVSIPAQGESENPLGLLYREFAVQTGNTLTGKIIKPVVDDSWRPR